MNYKKSMKNRGAKYDDYTKDLHESWLARDYSVSKHAAHRWSERVFKCPTKAIDREELIKIAKCLVGSLDITLDPNVNGVFPLLDEYRAVIRNGIVVTIKDN